MVERHRRGVHVGLAVASALVVLVSSGVAVTRLGSRHSDRHRLVAIASPTEPSHRAAPAALLPDLPQSTLGGEASPVTPVAVPRQRHWRPGSIQAPRVAVSAALPTTAQGRQPPDSPPALTAKPAGSSGTSTASAAQPSPAVSEPLMAVSVSAGQGNTGGVVGIGLDHDPDVDVTVGTTPLVGHAPPSRGTEVALGGQLLHPPPTIPVLPGAIST